MPTSKVQAPSSSLQSLSLKMPEGFKSKVVAPRNPKLVKHEDRPIRSSSVDVDQAMFQPFPSEIVFQNYIPSETYEVPLVLRNNDKVGGGGGALGHCGVMEGLGSPGSEQNHKGWVSALGSRCST
ncbi:hypothetical protein JZ751_020966, partial [Albula glossodonta]